MFVSSSRRIIRQVLPKNDTRSGLVLANLGQNTCIGAFMSRTRLCQNTNIFGWNPVHSNSCDELSKKYFGSIRQRIVGLVSITKYVVVPDLCNSNLNSVFVSAKEGSQIRSCPIWYTSALSSPSRLSLGGPDVTIADLTGDSDWYRWPIQITRDPAHYSPLIADFIHLCRKIGSF